MDRTGKKKVRAAQGKWPECKSPQLVEKNGYNASQQSGIGFA